MNIDHRTPRDWSRLLLASVAVKKPVAAIDDYGCRACHRKSCPGCSEWLFAEDRDEAGIPW